MKSIFSILILFKLSLIAYSQEAVINLPELIFVSGGHFEMGCTEEQREDCLSDEYPVKDVKLFDFWIGKFEVTHAQYAEFLSEEGNTIEGGEYWYRIDKYSLIEEDQDGNFTTKNGFENHPVSNVSWYGAQAYTKWLTRKTGKNYRLPTEAEWEYAARGGQESNGYLYSGSNQPEDVAWSSQSAGNSNTGWGFKNEVGTHPVGNKAPNELGIYDMSGNLKEWCSTSYHNSHILSDNRVTDSSYRILRGGSWDNRAPYARVSARDSGFPTSSWAINKGFRVVMDINIKPKLDAYATENDFSGTILIERAGNILYHNSFGFSDFDLQTPNSKETRFPIASITKLFTSVIILQMVEESKIKLHDTISKYLPTYPGDGASQVTIHQLLTHTSGIRHCEEIKLEDSNLPAVYQVRASIDELLDMYCAGPLVDEPGTVYNYNNGEYVILGKIIEMIEGEAYQNVLQSRVLAPLGMNATGLITYSPEADHIDLAKGYYWDDEADKLLKNPDILYQNYYAGGAMFSTSGDLLKFSNAIHNHKLLDEHSLELLLTTYIESRGYGYGQWIRFRDYGKTVYKVTQRFGRIWGINAILSHFIEADLTVVVVSNTNQLHPGDIHNFVGNLLLDK